MGEAAGVQAAFLTGKRAAAARRPGRRTPAAGGRLPCPGGAVQARGCTCTTPASPSTVTTWPLRRRTVASPVPTTAGIPHSRATSDAWAKTRPCP